MESTLRPVDKKAALIIILASILLLAVGLLTGKPYVGDEVCHYKFTKDMFRLQKRIATEPDEIYNEAPYLHQRYLAAVLWQTVLTKIWRVTGGVSESTAQIYHTIYFVVLITCIYLLAKEKYGEDAGLDSLFVVISTPMVVLFSVVFYMEVPLLAFTAICFLMITKKRYLFAGIALGLMILTKINGLFFIPSLVLLVYCYSEGSWKTKLKNVFVFSSVALLINIPDMHFRYIHFKRIYLYFPIRKLIHTFLPVPIAYHQKQIVGTEGEIILTQSANTKYCPSSILDPIDVLTYFGVTLLVLIVLYFILRTYKKKDNFIWLGIASYIVAYLFYMYRSGFVGCDIRYLMPIVPFLAIIAGKTLSSLRRKSFRSFFLIACCLQFIAAAVFTYSYRKIPKGITQAYSFINSNLPEDTILLYPGRNVRDYAERLTIWHRLKPSLPVLFWQADEKKTLEILTDNNIGYIAVKKSRIYNDSKERHTGGYPKSFIEKTAKLSFVKLVFDNKEMSIWKVE